MSLDRFFHRTYSTSEYNCAHFVVEVWRELTGQDVRDAMSGFLYAPRDRRVVKSRLAGVRFLERPVSPCFVYMQRRGCAPHVGIFKDDRVIHITAESNVQFVPLDIATLGFKRVRFFHVN